MIDLSNCLEQFICKDPKDPTQEVWHTQEFTIKLINANKTWRNMSNEVKKVFDDYNNMKHKLSGEYFDFMRIKDFFLKEFKSTGRVCKIEKQACDYYADEIYIEIKSYEKV